MSDDLTTSIPPYTPPTPSNEPPAPVEPAAPTQPVAAAPVNVASPAGPAKAKRSSTGRWINVLLGVAVIVAVGGVAFAVGRTTAPAAASTRFGGNGNGGFAFPGGSFDPNNPGFVTGGNGNGNGGSGAGRFLAGGGITITGTVDSVSADSMTITTASGQQVTVALDSKTTYHQQAAGSASDVQTGGKVSVELQLGGAFRNGNGNGGTGNGTNGNGSGNGGTPNGGNGTPNGSGTSRGTASSVTVIP